MSVPTAVLIDTSVFDQNAYNFSSPIFSAFVEIASKTKVQVLLPDSIEREVNRHIHDGANKAFKALEEVRRKAPFVAKWKHWPKERITEHVQHEIEAAASNDWREFLTKVSPVRMGYDKINLTHIMDWYDAIQPPFREGAKRKEFPDAFTIASALAYANEKGGNVAIVSTDSDHKAACDLYRPKLQYFGSVAELTESLLTLHADLLERIKNAVRANAKLLENRISEEFPERSFYPAEDPNGDVSDIEVDSATIREILVLEVSGHVARVSIEAHVSYSAHLRFPDHESAVVDSAEDVYMPLHWRAGSVSDWYPIDVVTDIEVDADYKHIVAIHDLNIADDDIPVEGYPPIEPEEEDFDESQGH